MAPMVELQVAARRALAERDGDKLTAIGYLRSLRTGASLQNCVEAVEWALSNPKVSADDLPDGSVVADFNRVWIKNHPTSWSQWRCTNGGHYDNASVNDELASGATVLRLGPDGA